MIYEFAGLPLHAGPHASTCCRGSAMKQGGYGEARHPPGRLLDHADRREQPGAHLHVAWKSLVEREKWLATVAETEKDGPPWQDISSQLLQPTEFSSVK
jgi:hypothetical protein